MTSPHKIAILPYFPVQITLPCSECDGCSIYVLINPISLALAYKRIPKKVYNNYYNML